MYIILEYMDNIGFSDIGVVRDEDGNVVFFDSREDSDYFGEAELHYYKIVKIS